MDLQGELKPWCNAMPGNTVPPVGGSAPAPRVRGAQCLPGPEIWSEEGASIIVLQMSFRPKIYQSGAGVGTKYTKKPA